MNAQDEFGENGEGQEEGQEEGKEEGKGPYPMPHPSPSPSPHGDGHPLVSAGHTSRRRTGRRFGVCAYSGWPFLHAAFTAAS